jgi:hypothetical protein
VPTTLRVSILGTGFAIDCADPALAAELRRLLAGFRAPPEEPGQAMPADRPPVAVSAPLGTGADTVLAELNAAALAGADCLAVHAGVVAAGGRAVAFPGPSGVGKTTLTVACLVAGLEYGSDEALCLDWDSGAVRPYPRPLALAPAAAVLAGALTGPASAARPADGGATTVDDRAEVLLTAADIGAQVATGPLVLAHVALPRRMAAAATPTLQPAPRGAAVAELLRRSFTSHRRPEQAFALAHRVIGAAATWWLDLGDPRAAAGLLAELLRRDAAATLDPGGSRRSW